LALIIYWNPDASPEKIFFVFFGGDCGRGLLNTTLAKIESDVIENPSLQTITKIAEGLGVSLDELVK
jgi:hypothetical protein